MANEKNNQTPLISFSVYLIKKNITDPSAILRAGGVSFHTFISHANEDIGELFVKATDFRLPRWAKIFRGYVDESQIGEVATSSAVLLVKAKSRYFAVTFGQGRYLLEPDCWEERFGLLVALNSIGENQIKSIDKRTFDAISKHSREQASREVGAQDFGLDVEQDLLRAVTGTPAEPSLGHRLSGMDALKTTVRANIEDIPLLLRNYYDMYMDSSYKHKFPWVDHLTEIKGHELSDKLDQLLIERISEEDFSRCWLAVPDIVDWDQVSGFRYGFSSRSPIYHDIHFPDFLDSLPDGSAITTDKLKRKYVYCVGEDYLVLHKWPVYKCVYCELDYGDDSYLLSGGKWYRVTRDFVRQINDAYNRIPRYRREFPEFNHASEGDYNQYVALKDPDEFALMDKKTIQYGGGYNRIEFCDLYTKSGSMIHVKRYGGSSVLSHLFAQGIVSGELFQTDAEFRHKVNQILPETHKLRDTEQQPTMGKHEIVFAVISDAGGSALDLPFFSRLNLRHAVRRLEGYGYKAAVAKISVNDHLRKLERYV
jgi:uncharacterized protein (TIGR04141 family)